MPQHPPLKIKQPSSNFMHSSAIARDLCTHGRSGYGNNTNVPSLRHCSWKETKCDVKDVEGVFVVN